MNHFHPTILIVLVERHPHALNKSNEKLGDDRSGRTIPGDAVPAQALSQLGPGFFVK